MLQEMHFRNISQRAILQRRTEEAAKYLEQTRLQSSHVFGEEFTVTEDLMGLAIGAHGANIQQARKIDGILNVELVEDSCKFKVRVVLLRRRMFVFTRLSVCFRSQARPARLWRKPG